MSEPREKTQKEEPISMSLHLWGQSHQEEGTQLLLTFMFFLKVRYKRCLKSDTSHTSNHAGEIHIKHLAIFHTKWRPNYMYFRTWNQTALNCTLALKYCIGPSEALQCLVV